jgi:5-(carboxyamino)imidazole ribonucleotide synthase
VELHVQTPGAEDPATRTASSVVLADVDDAHATRRLADRCSAISFENEWLNLSGLEPLERDGIRFLPALDTLRPLLSKRNQRELLDRLHLPCPRWCPLKAVWPAPITPETSSVENGVANLPATAASSTDPSAGTELDTATTAPGTGPPRLPDGFRFPVIAKASRGGYDGRGTVPIHTMEQLLELLHGVDQTEWILEEMVSFDRELALVACRDSQGAVACYPLVETHQRRQVCEWVLFPASVDHAVEAFARNIAVSVLTALDYVGVLGIEFFYGPQGLQVNELAPRTHNSGHLSIEAFRASQFHQQVRIVAGFSVAPTEPIVPAALMVNLLGFEDSEDDYQARRRALESLPHATLHWYGKHRSIPSRKLGHITLRLLAEDPEQQRREAEQLLTRVRDIWPPPAAHP